jgi:hypothetical protein
MADENFSMRQTFVMAGQDDMLAQVAGHNANMAQLTKVFTTRFALSSFTGTFNMTATATITVPDANIKAASVILFVPTNAAAAQLQGSAKQLYVSTKAAGTNFVAATGNAVAAAGTETFGYVILNVG